MTLPAAQLLPILYSGSWYVLANGLLFYYYSYYFKSLKINESLNNVKGIAETLTVLEKFTSIVVESEKGSGTSVTFRLPLGIN